MRKIAYMLSLFIGILLVSCGGSAEKKEVADDTPIVYGEHKVEVYYFHGDRRCPGCNAIENVTEKTVAEAFAGNTDVKYYAINFDRNQNKDIAKKYDIAWSSLLIVSGKRAIDLTLEAFQYASSSPDILKNEIIEVVNDFLNS